MVDKTEVLQEAAYIAEFAAGRLEAFDPVMNRNGELFVMKSTNGLFLSPENWTECTDEEYGACLQYYPTAPARDISSVEEKLEAINLEISKINAKLDRIMTFDNMNEIKMTPNKFPLIED